MKVVCISDTHNLHREIPIPKGDILIHAGDITNIGTMAEFDDFNQWLGELPHRNKIIIAGNHDFLFERNHISHLERFMGRINAHYLQDSEIQVAGLRIYGTPWTPTFMDWAFMKDEQFADVGEATEIYSKIPPNLDILITHGPPRGILDMTPRGEAAGSGILLQRVWDVRPRYHVFGHIHEGYGRIEKNGTTFINAALSRGWEKYKKVPIVLEI